jgi:predicted transcriptional regulator
MKKEVKKMLQELKDKKITVSKIEKDLNIPSGLLWKVKEGVKTINQERMDQLIEYHKKNTRPIFLSALNAVEAPKDFFNEVKKVTNKKLVANKIKSACAGKEVKINLTKDNYNPQNKPVMPKGLSLSDQLKWRIENG